MPKINLKVDIRYQWWLFILITVSLISGLAFFALNNWFEIKGEFGFEKHPAQFPILKIHGAAAFLMMMTYGFFLGGHARAGWKVKNRPILGIIVAILPLLLMISGYLLYYIASDLTREIVVYFHVIIGISLPIILILHIKTAAKKLKKARRFRHA